ncbi:MAG: mandelate racemase/muconate lactonizing enzyme family protein [Candidatus Hodarchaeota archaeon]
MNPNNSLKVTSIDIFKLNIPLKSPFKIALGTSYEANNILVRINTNKDIYGLGEACASSRITGDTQSTSLEAGKHIAKVIKGKDPLAIEARMRDINQAIKGNTQIKSAYNLALYDIIGKYTNLPLYKILGGEKRDIFTDYSIGIQDNLEVAVKKVKEVLDMGFLTVKLKVGLDKDLDIGLIKTIREEVSKTVSIRIDANQGWDFPTAVQVLKAMEPHNLEYAEQPLPFWDYENMARLRKTGLAPICADESVFDHHDAFKLASMGACDYLNIKLGKSGGISTALKINAIALSCGIKCMIGCFGESRLGLTAGAHLVSACPNIVFVDLDAALMHKEDPIKGGIQYEIKKNGRIIIPDTPGHGADVEEEYLDNLEKIVI